MKNLLKRILIGRIGCISRSIIAALVAIIFAAAVAPVSPVAVAAKPSVEFTLSSCCVTEEVMRQAIIPGFEAYWKVKTGQDVRITATFAGSGTLKNQILGGAPSQVAVLSSELYADQLKEKGFVSTDWRKSPNKGTVVQSTIILLTRPGNPKGIRSFADLTKPGTSVIHSSPATSGGAQWSILAVYGSALKDSERKTGSRDRDAARKLLLGVGKNVIATPESAAQTMAQFNAGFGDALITYENEALYELKKGLKYTIVVPESTIETEWKAIRIDKNIKPEQAEVVDAFLEYLRSEEAQKQFARYGFRSIYPRINEANQAQYAKIEVPFNIDYLGGWKEARKAIIDGVWKEVQEAVKKQ